MTDEPTVERVLVVTAHPDDVDFSSAGTVATWTDAGTAVTYCVCTDGQAGGFDPDVPRERIPEIRRSEQRAAASHPRRSAAPISRSSSRQMPASRHGG